MVLSPNKPKYSGDAGLGEAPKLEKPAMFYVIAELKRAIEAMRVAGGSVEFQIAFDRAKALLGHSVEGSDGATPAPMDPGVLVVRATSGEEFVFDAGTHSYDVWVSDRRRWRKVEITMHTDKGSWIVKSIDFPVSIERRFSTPSVGIEPPRSGRLE